MAKITSEYAFEEHIEEVLIKTHGYFPAKQADYDKTFCLRPETVISFIRATQTKRWADYCALVGDKDQAVINLLKRIKEVVDKEGTLHVLRKGFDIHGGGHFDLCYFEPTNPAADESRRLYQENLLQEVLLRLRQLDLGKRFECADGCTAWCRRLQSSQ